MGASLPLDDHPVFRSRDGDAARAFLHAKDFEFEIAGRGRGTRRVDVRINAVYLPSLVISAVGFGAAAETGAAPERADYRIQFPLGGAAETVFGRDRVVCGGSQGVITSPTAPQRIALEPGCRRVLVMFTRDALTRHLAALLGQPLTRALAFRPALDLARGPGRSLVEYLRLALREFDRPDAALRNPLALAQFEQLFMTALLLAHPHNYSDALAGRAADVVPRDVRRAVDYIHAHLHMPVTLADLVAATGVPGRTLRQHFRDFKGLSPTAYLRRARYQRARTDLLCGDGASVTEVAQRWGFEHLGRFAAGYRRLYGERPSDTARRAADDEI